MPKARWIDLLPRFAKDAMPPLLPPPAEAPAPPKPQPKPAPTPKRRIVKKAA